MAYGNLQERALDAQGLFEWNHDGTSNLNR